MPNARNLEMMESIKADLEGVNAMWVIDACGLTVKETEALRRAIRESGAIMKVYKNTIMKKALAELDLVNMDAILEGPSAFVFCDGDVAAAAKAITEFAKENKKLEVKGGMMDNTFIAADEVQAIASLPSKEVLIAQSLAPFPVSHVVSPFPSMACRAVLLVRSNRLPIRRLRNRSNRGLIAA